MRHAYMRFAAIVAVVVAAFGVSTAARAADTTPPVTNVTAPVADSAVAGTALTLTATASDAVGVVGVQFILDETVSLGAEDVVAPYTMTWDSTSVSNGLHTISAKTRDAARNYAVSIINITVDNEVPAAGTILINGGAAFTKSTAVTLTLSATDAVTSITQMRFSNNGTSFNTAVAYNTTASWTLTTGAGTKTVYAQFKDAAGNWSPVSTATIILDTTAPTISAVATSSITGTSAVITWTTNEPATSQSNYGLTTSYGTTTTLDATLVTSHSITLTGLNPNTTYNFRVRSKDGAGNERVSGNFIFTTAAATDTAAPSNPTNLVAVPMSSAQIDLSWTASTDNVGVVGYEVFQDGVQVGTTANTFFSNFGLSPATAYTFAVRAYDAAGNRSGFSASAITSTTQVPTSTGAASLGAHTLAWLACGSNGPITTSPITTQSSNSTLLAWVARGNISDFTASTIPTDNKGNVLSMIGTVHDYTPYWANSGEAMYQITSANGGANHIFTAPLPTADEVTMAVVEVKNGGVIADAQWVKTVGSAPNTSANVTVNGPATLVALWAGDGADVNMTAVPDNGFTVIDSQLVNTTCAIQTVVAVKEVTVAGTYNVTWTASPVQGAHLWLIAVQSAAPDTTTPSVPASLTAVPVSDTQINLSWIASTDNIGVTGYQVFRNGSTTPVATPSTNSYSDTGLTASTLYTYTVKAVDAAGNVSGTSSPVSTTTLSVPPPDTTPPVVVITAPLQGAILSSGTTATTLSVSTNESSTCAYATTAGTPFGSMTVFGTTGAVAHSTTLSGLTNGSAYTYYVKCSDVSANVSSDTSTSFSVANPGSGVLAQTNIQSQLLTESTNAPISVTGATFTPPSNSLLVVSTLMMSNQANGTETVSGGGLTWTKRMSFVSPIHPSGYEYTQEIWTAPVSTASSMAVTVDSTGTSGTDPTRVNLQIIAFTGYDTVAPIGATASGSSLGSGAATITLSAAPATNSVVVATKGTADVNNTNSLATPGTGWTEVFDQATSYGYGDMETEVRTGSNSTAVTWNDMADPAGASLWEASALALEIKAAN